MTIKEWKLVEQNEIGQAYLYRDYKGFNVEVHQVSKGIEVAVYDKKGNIIKPPFRLEIEFDQFVPRYKAIMQCLEDLIDSIIQDK